MRAIWQVAFGSGAQQLAVADPGTILYLSVLVSKFMAGSELCSSCTFGWVVAWLGWSWARSRLVANLQ